MSDQTLDGTEGISEATSESAINAACFPATTENKTKQVQVLPVQHWPRKPQTEAERERDKRDGDRRDITNTLSAIDAALAKVKEGK